MELEAGVGENKNILVLQVFFSLSYCEQGPARGFEIMIEDFEIMMLHQMKEAGSGSWLNRCSCPSVDFFIRDFRYLQQQFGLIISALLF